MTNSKTHAVRIVADKAKPRQFSLWANALKNRPSFRQGRRNPASKDGKLCVVWMLKAWRQKSGLHLATHSTGGPPSATGTRWKPTNTAAGKAWRNSRGLPRPEGQDRRPPGCSSPFDSADTRRNRVEPQSPRQRALLNLPAERYVAVHANSGEGCGMTVRQRQGFAKKHLADI
jgi:hypothetical protein